MPRAFGDRSSAPIPASTFKAAAKAAVVLAGVVAVGALKTGEGMAMDRAGQVLIVSAGTFIGTFMFALLALALMHARTSVIKADWASGHDGIPKDSNGVLRRRRVERRDDGPPSG
jgi:hypothetical protein